MNYKICTFNVRVDTPSDGINSFSTVLDGERRFSARSQLVAAALRREQADVIGFQEVLPHVRSWLEEAFPEYTVIGCGREGDRDGESTPIAFRTDRFYLVASETFWLSPNPSLPGSRFLSDQSGCPRTCCTAVLVDRVTHEMLRVYNTHLDHVGERARAQGMSVVLEHIARDDDRFPGVPLVLMGDFNATPDSPFLDDVNGLVSNGCSLLDVSVCNGPTFHGYHPDESSVKIDYIYTNAPCDPNATYLLADEEAGVYLSDHYPVVCMLKKTV